MSIKKTAIYIRVSSDKQAQNTPDFAPIRALKGVNITEVYKSLTPQEKRRFWRSIVKRIYFNAEREIGIEYLGSIN